MLGPALGPWRCPEPREPRSVRRAADKRFVDGAERESLLVATVSQDAMWHGAAQTTAGYVEGITQVCHSSSAGRGPCLKRIVTVFALPDDHPLASLSAVQRLLRVGIAVHAVEPKHQLPARPQPSRTDLAIAEQAIVPNAANHRECGMGNAFGHGRELAENGGGAGGLLSGAGEARRESESGV